MELTTRKNQTYRLADRYFLTRTSYVKEKVICIKCFFSNLRFKPGRMKRNMENEFLKHKAEAMINTMPIMRMI